MNLFRNTILQCIFFASILIFSNSTMAIDTNSSSDLESDWSVLTNEKLTIKGLSIGMSYMDAVNLFPQIASKTAKTFKNAEMTENWATLGDTVVVLEKNELTCIGVSQKKKCTKFSLMEEYPEMLFLAFVGDKLSYVSIIFNRSIDSYNLDPFYVEIKRVYVEKFISEPNDNRVEADENSFTKCRWVNTSQKATISLLDKKPDNKDPKFKVIYESTDYRKLLESRIEDYNNKVREEAAAKEKKDADRKKNDL